MRILHLIPQLSGGGAERQLCLLAPEMAKLGHNVHIACLNDESDNLPLPGVFIHRIPVMGNYDPTLLFKLANLIRMIEPNIIHSWILMMDILAGCLSLKKKAMWIIREPTSANDYKNFNLKKLLRKWLGHKASAIVANSKGGRDYWLGQGISETSLFVIPNAVPFDFINSVRPFQKGCDSRKSLIFAGRLVRSKNIDTLIRSMPKIRKTHDVSLLIAGEGPSKPELMALADSIGLNKHVRFLGRLNPHSLWAHMKTSDIFVSLSDYEGMPNAVTEAIACGLPVALSDIPAHREFLDDTSSFFVHPKSIQELANNICYILDRKDDVENRIARSLKAIEDSTPLMAASEYIRFYKKFTNRKHPVFYEPY